MKLNLKQGLLVFIIFCFSTVPCLGSERVDIHTLSTGDAVYRQDTSVVVRFNSPRNVLSTSVLNGGYQGRLDAVFNHDMKGATGIDAASYPDYLQDVARQLGLKPGKASGMGTAASMDNVAIWAESYETLTVTAIVTGGVEGNGGRAGDPATYFIPVKKKTLHKPGTINIMLVIDADIPVGTMTRALVTCTEAKTAALQELMAGSKFSTGLATGSGTDQTIVISNPGSPLYLEDAGKHSKLGELIGRTVKQAVKEALQRQTGLSPARQHSMLRRLERYGVTEQTLYRQYLRDYRAIDRQQFLSSLRQLDNDSPLVAYTSLYVHLLDQFQWQLLSDDELAQTGNELLQVTAGKYHISPPVLATPGLESGVQAWSGLVVDIVAERVNNDK